ncbi:MAG: NAD(P)H-hydrate dehydratase [Betaproteobacteria bacterium]|nr:NAD(P)H-hydrate dehydratase [Betaproteobacteria bacterium]
MSFSPLYRAQALREIERQAGAQARPPLMERAGLAIARAADTLKLDLPLPILVVAGPGNNGGDALVAARHLVDWGIPVDLVFTGRIDRLSADARRAWDAWASTGRPSHEDIPPAGRWSLAIDGLFGTGLTRDIEEADRRRIAKINALACPVLSIDVPSGLDADTGAVRGAAVRASLTVTLLAHKPGLYTLDGKDLVGRIQFEALGADAPSLVAPQGFLLNRSVSSFLPARPANTHKGHFGQVGILGGADTMVGAAFLAGSAALLAGAGRVYLGLLAADLPGFSPYQPELMVRRAETLLAMESLTCLVAGPGLSQSTPAQQCLTQALERDLPLVLDADALNLLGRHPALAARIPTRTAATLLTPHPLEAARLLGREPADIQRDRIGAAGDLARRFQSYVVLKGSGSVCAEPGGTYYVNPTGNPGLASAGTGDVLSGILGALIGQGLAVPDALRLGVYLHGAAADDQVARGDGPVGLTASEVALAARRLLNDWIYRPAP